MGMLSRMKRAERFIKEFGNEILENWAMDVEGAVASRELALHEGTGCVHIFYSIEGKGGQHAVMSPDPVYEVEGDELDCVEYVREFLGIEDAEARRRLKKAGLL